MDLVRISGHRRRRARWLLYGGLGLIVAALAAAAWLMGRPPDFLLPQKWLMTDFENHPDVRLLRDYVRIDTSQETGSELAGAEFFAARLEELGLEPRIERLGERSANLWAVVEGDEPGALVLHHHIDVSTPGDPGEWSHPPFAGVIERPWIYGRGTFDMKSVAVAQLQALRSLLEERPRPRRSIVVLATGSEETGSELGVRWILERHPELAGRIWAVLTEGGVVEVTSHDDVKYWGIEFAQRRFGEAVLCSSDRARLERLRQEIVARAEGEARPRVTPEVATFLAAYGGTRTHPQYRELLGEVWRTALDPAAFRALPGYLRSVLASEVVAFEVEDDPGGGHRMRLLFHLLPGDDFHEVRERLLPAWLIHGVAATFVAPVGAEAGSPVDHPVFEALVAAVGEAFPDAPAGPYFLPWSATDSRFFRAAGIPAYGFSPFILFSTDTFRVDGVDERMDLVGFLRGVDLYRDVLIRLAG